MSPSCLRYEVLAWRPSHTYQLVFADCRGHGPLTRLVVVVTLAVQGLTLLFLNVGIKEVAVKKLEVRDHMKDHHPPHLYEYGNG